MRKITPYFISISGKNEVKKKYYYKHKSNVKKKYHYKGKTNGETQPNFCFKIKQEKNNGGRKKRRKRCPFLG